MVNTIQYIHEGDVLNQDILQNYNISNLVKINDYITTSNFVGVVMSDQGILASFPKHYNYNNLDERQRSNAINKIISFLSKGLYTKSSNEDNNFPLDSYLIIKEYYQKYGIYRNNTKINSVNGRGRINWKKTIQKSNKIVQENSIVFLPLITSKRKYENVFVTECMEFVLFDSYHKYSLFTKFFIPYYNKPQNRVFNNFDTCLKVLNKIKGNYFKDTEKKLINALIKFFRWKATKSSNLVIATTDFEDYWETMIHFYLNVHFEGFENDRIVFGKNNFYNFRKKTDKVSEHSEKARDFSVEYDHLAVNESAKEVIVLDSKYRKEITSLDYKQAFYDFQLREQYGDSYTYFNGLIIPSESSYHIRVHVDKNIYSEDGEQVTNKLKIVEHYIKLEEILDFILRHRLEFMKLLK